VPCFVSSVKACAVSLSVLANGFRVTWSVWLLGTSRRLRLQDPWPWPLNVTPRVQLRWRVLEIIADGLAVDACLVSIMA
jgi:hypothetical protein